MSNTLILCGGTGAHVGVAFVRFHILGHALGFFHHQKAADFPTIFLVDQDSGDGSGGYRTAWQEVRRLIHHHPGRHDWFTATGRRESPKLIQATPLPIGDTRKWYQSPYSTLATRFERSNVLPALVSRRQRSIDYSKGMMASPAVGSLLFALKAYDTHDRSLNNDETFGQMMNRQGTIAVIGSGVGGTGASVAPTLAKRLASGDGREVMSVMVHNWFELVEEGVADEIREKAQLRNRIMRENANSAMQFYGHEMAGLTAAVPVGVPEKALVKRYYTSDLQQPVQECFLHAVAALCAERHFLDPKSPGLYQLGAVDPAQLEGSTAIPGGTLQSLANQAATVTELLEVWSRVLRTSYPGRIVPAIYEDVENLATPEHVAGALDSEAAILKEQLDWMREKLGIQGKARLQGFSREAEVRQRLDSSHHKLAADRSGGPEAVAGAVFRWTCDWIREKASSTDSIGLVGQAGPVTGGYWPELRGEGLGVAAERAGDLTRISDQNIDGVLQAFVDPEYLASNGWPHPLAAADYFRFALSRGEALATRQLEMLMLGLIARILELRPIQLDSRRTNISLDRLVEEHRRQGFEGIAEWAVVYPADREFDEDVILGFNAPHTLLCPTPAMGEDDGDEHWERLWDVLLEGVGIAEWRDTANPADWSPRGLLVDQIRSWIEHQKRAHANVGTAPPWTKIFSGLSSTAKPLPFGTGRQLNVYWGGANERAQSVRLALPEAEVGRWMPPEGTPPLREEELYDFVPELLELKDANGRRRFNVAEFEVPDSTELVRGWWQDHLDTLVQEGRIFVWAPTDEGGIVIGKMLEDDGVPVLHATYLERSRPLSRREIEIKNLIPLHQDPVPGSSVNRGEIRYPDLPIRSEFLGLVEQDDGRRLLDLLRNGESASVVKPRLANDARGRQTASWQLRLAGRAELLTLEVRTPADIEDRAHWMVWPKFRTEDPSSWKAYYIYDRCENPNLRVRPLWLDGQSHGPPTAAGVGRLRKGIPEEGGASQPESFSYPLSYDSDSGQHTGGPPLALALCDLANELEQGLYLVPLTRLQSVAERADIALDFGTSHSVAAFSSGEGTAEQIELSAQLARNPRDLGLTLHICECRSFVEAPENEVGVLAAGDWLPTYKTGSSTGFLPSELLLTQKVTEAHSDDVKTWVPLRDYVIPAMDIARRNLSEHLLTDFKWNTMASDLRGRDKELREHYLKMLLELASAEVIWKLKAVPSQPVDLTFTYPLRSSRNEVQQLQASLKEILHDARESLGLDFTLQDQIGLFDESRAARLTARRAGEVCLVADLGGGTLDLFIDTQTGPGGKVPQVADSVRIGANILLHQMAQSPDGLLPDNESWRGDPKDIETKLRAWMRSLGAPSLFGFDAGGSPRLDRLDVVGYENAHKAESARELIDTYFGLIVEYMARNLVAYLTKFWYPRIPKRDHDKLKIAVQLRGNGWRLHYRSDDYQAIIEAVRDLTRIRLRELWPLVEENPFPCPEDTTWASASEYSVENPKLAPIKSVVGQAMSWREVSENWHSHTLTNLEVLEGTEGSLKVPWYSKVPFDTGGSKHVEVMIEPPIPIGHPATSANREPIEQLNAQLTGKINNALQNEGMIDQNRLRAPVAPLLWEIVFEAKLFWPESVTSRS